MLNFIPPKCSLKKWKAKPSFLYRNLELLAHQMVLLGRVKTIYRGKQIFWSCKTKELVRKKARQFLKFSVYRHELFLYCLAFPISKIPLAAFSKGPPLFSQFLTISCFPIKKQNKNPPSKIQNQNLNLEVLLRYKENDSVTEHQED